MATNKFTRFAKSSDNQQTQDYFEYADDPDFIEEAPTSSLPRLLTFGFYGSLLALGITFGANIALNSGGTGVEFGQGVTQVVTCQGTSNTITLTPYAGFQNVANGGFFGLDSVILENIHQDCVGKDFIVRVYNNSSNTPLVISESATSVGVYETYTATRFHWSDSSTVTLMGNQYTDIELLNDLTTSTDFTTNATAMQIVFDADTVSSFANTSEVYKITLELAPHTGATS